LSHYAPDDKQFDNVCFDMAQDDAGILYFATKGGILQFDGRNWDLIKGTGAVYTLSINAAGDIFWGGASGFGEIKNRKSGFRQRQFSATKDIFQSLAVNDLIYFLNDKAVFVHSLKTSKTTEIKATPATGSFSGIFELFGQVYINAELAGMLSVEKNNLKASNAALQNLSEVSFSEKLGNEYLLGTTDGRLYNYSENKKLKEIPLADKEYAKAGVVINGSWVNKQLVALGTLRGGVMFINIINGKTEEIINYNTGLPDNEVFALMCDKNRNVWVAHDYGFTRIAPYLPLRSFSYYNGLQGNLLCAITFENQVYVGTSLGLFKLQKEELYDEISYYVNVLVEEKKKGKNKKEKKKEVQQVIPELEQPVVAEPESKKRGFFGFLKRKNKPQETLTNAPVVVEKTDTEKTEQTNEPNIRQEKRTQRILRSSNFVYKKVLGVEAKVTQLLEVNGKLMAAGLAGIHQVNDLTSQPILQEPVRHIFSNKKFLLASTYDNEVKSWSINNGLQKVNLLRDVEDDINFIFEGSEKELWLCSRDQIYRVEISHDTVKHAEAFQLPVKNFDESEGVYLKGQAIIVNAEGFFAYQANEKGFVKIDSLPKPTSYFSWANTIWYHDLHGWKSIGTSGDQSNLQLLNLFQDLRFITADKYHDNLWLITGNNELFKFFGERLHPHETAYPLILKSIYNGDSLISYQAKIKINEQHSAVSIEVVQPDYVGAGSMEYRYFLKGLHNEWSDWATSNNKIDFPYLPQGKYALQVQARNMFGNIKEMEPLSFVVQPPYWQRPWFYALEFVLFGLLVLLSFRLSSRYLIVSRILSLLTIILLIQFIQTVASASLFSKESPVIDFFIQVFVALLILPVEGYLRKLMLRSQDTSTGISQYIKKKTKEKFIGRKK
jgi:hypothetical protein